MVLSGRHLAHGIVKNPLLNEFAGWPLGDLSKFYESFWLIEKMMGIRMLVVSENDDHFQVWWWEVCHLNWLTGDFCVPYFSTNALFGSFGTPGVTGVQAQWISRRSDTTAVNRGACFKVLPESMKEPIPIYPNPLATFFFVFIMLRHVSPWSWGNMLIPGPEEHIIPSPSNRQRSLSFRPPAPAQGPVMCRGGDRSWSGNPHYRLGMSWARWTWNRSQYKRGNPQKNVIIEQVWIPHPPKIVLNSLSALKWLKGHCGGCWQPEGADASAPRFCPWFPHESLPTSAEAQPSDALRITGGSFRNARNVVNQAAVSRCPGCASQAKRRWEATPATQCRGNAMGLA